eukprot:scaffold55767_cov36-Tisochrysis_lutea.AAC.1
MAALDIAHLASEEVARVCGFSEVVGTKVILAMGRHGGCADAEPVSIVDTQTDTHTHTHTNAYKYTQKHACTHAACDMHKLWHRVDPCYGRAWERR